MALASGTRLGPYEIVAPLGAGGMGEVYRARDTRLGREVAIKVLPSHLSGNPTVRERFDREARAISNLSHAHICTLHDIGHQDGTDYLVMELLDGESLADRTAKGPLPLKDVIRYGAEIAEALDKAHKQGIVHRDLKPGNVMITKAGAKVLDFGLAKYASDNSSLITDPSSFATEHKPLTAEGTILGTLQYMAPEQLEGRDADGRTDIFALGAVLYEMSTGRRAFEGKSRASLIASIMSSEPQPISAIAPMTPPALDRVVRTCLEKDPDDRWQSARDLARELRSLSPVTDAPSQRPPARTRLLPAAALLLGIVLAASAVVAVRQRSGAAGVSSDPARVRRFSITLPENAPLASAATPFNYLRPGFAVSPDGSQIAYVSKAGDRTQLYLRRLNELEPKAVPGTEGGFDPFFSPDGEWLGFFTFDALHKVSLKGGSPLTLTRVVNPAGGTWCDNGTIFFAAEEGEALWRVATGSGTTDQSAARVSLDRSLPHAPYPYCLPGSAGLLLSVNDPAPAQRSAPGLPASTLLTFDYASVVVLPLAKEKSAARLLAKRGYAPQYASSGHLVFARAGSLMAAPFDLAELRVTGPEVAVLDGVRMCSVALPSAQFAITRSGSLLYVPGGDYGRTRLVWVDSNGALAPTAVAPNLFGTLNLSPDGQRVVAEVGGIQNDVYVYDLRDGRGIRITRDGSGGGRPLWHPDGRRIVFHSEAENRYVIKPVESGAGPQAVTRPDWQITSWSTSGVLAGIHGRRIWVGSTTDQTPITSTAKEWGAVVSPDGRRVAYTSARTGTYQVFAQPIPPTGQEWQISAEFGEEPVWSRRSSDLFYRRHDQWWSVSFAGGVPAPPRLLFQGPYFNAFGPSYDISPDGRFLMALPAAGSDSTRELVWIDGWTSELKSRARS